MINVVKRNASTYRESDTCTTYQTIGAISVHMAAFL
jgi:hypothetical protein